MSHVAPAIFNLPPGLDYHCRVLPAPDLIVAGRRGPRYDPARQQE